MKPCQHSEYREGCRICFLARTSEKYARHWGEPWNGVTEPKIVRAPQPLPRKSPPWPWYARVLAVARAESDVGLGDTVHRLFSWLGAERLAAVYTKLSGNGCGCGSRQHKLNVKFPYR